jgi:hypothetical protein
MNSLPVQWPDTTRHAPPVDHHYASALWLLGRHHQLARLVERVPGVVEVDEDGPGLDLAALAAAILANDADVAAWDAYEAVRPAPRDDNAYELWRSQGPNATPQARAVAVMSSTEQTRLRLLATWSTVRVPLRVGDFRQLDSHGAALLGDWCTAVQAS